MAADPCDTVRPVVRPADTGPARRRRRGRRSALGASVAVAALVLTACGVPSNAPTAYDAQVQESFVNGCTGEVQQTGGTTTTLATAEYCTCAYQVFVANVPYDDNARAVSTYAGYPADAPTFSALNADLTKKDDPSSLFNALPASVQSAVTACANGGPTAPASTTSAPATTTTAG